MSQAQLAPERVPRRRPSPSTTGPAPRPRLRLVSQPQPRRRMPFVLICLVLLVVGLVSVLLMNITLSHNSYYISSLTKEQTELTERQQFLAEDLSYRGSPQNLAAAARALGMVPDPHPLFLRLSDGKVLGSRDTAPVTGAGTDIPGPAADARESSRPNLRDGEKLPPIGPQPATGSDKKAAGADTAAGEKSDGAPKLPDDQMQAPSQRKAEGGTR